MIKPQFYGLTGGIGSGKSTVAGIFASLGVPILDLDVVGKSLLGKSEIKNELVNAFGTSILINDNIQPAELRSKAFSSPEKTNELNAIMHPAIQKAELKWRKQQLSAFCIIEASVIIESGGANRMDDLIVVLSDLDIRMKRVLARGKQDKHTFKSIVNQQCTDEQRIACAKYILHNNHGIQKLQASVQKLYQTLTQ